MEKRPPWKKNDPVAKRNKNPDILEGLPCIAEFFGKSRHTISRWILNDGLPASKTPDGKWITHKTLLLQWMYAGHLAEMQQRRGAGGNSVMKMEDIGGDRDKISDLAEVMGVKLDAED